MTGWLITYGSWCLAPFGLLGMYVTGRKQTWGWLLALGTQCLWALYAVGTSQYGFLIGTCSYAAIYLKNYLSWHRPAAVDVAWMRRMIDEGRSEEVMNAYDDFRQDAALTALRLIYDDMYECRAAGDEWAMEWLGESWQSLVPLDLRVAVGDKDAAEEAEEARA